MNAEKEVLIDENLTSVPLIGVAVNAALASLKVIAGFFGNSYALIADGIESTSDIVTSLVVWGGLRVAVTPANERHPYGYGKAEAIAGIVAAFALLAAAAVIAFQSIREIMTPHHLPHWSTLLVLVAVVVIKESLARWVGNVGHASQSTSLQADSWHHRSDALTSLAAFIGISIALVCGEGYESADDWAALVACLVITYSGVCLLMIGVRELLDAAPPKQFEDQIRTLVRSIDNVRDVEKCRIRKSGTSYFVEIHVEVDENLTVRAGHEIGGRVRRRLRDSALRIADVFVHIEPFAEKRIPSQETSNLPNRNHPHAPTNRRD